MQARTTSRRLALTLLALFPAACGGGPAQVAGKDAAPSDVGAPETSVDASAGTGGADGSPDTGDGAGGSAGAPVTGDPGWTPIRHLTSYEYDRTVFDLLGVEGQAAKTFQSDEAGDGFDVVAITQAVNDARVEQYMDEAERLAEAAFANPTTRARVVTCHPAAND